MLKRLLSFVLLLSLLFAPSLEARAESRSIAIMGEVKFLSATPEADYYVSHYSSYGDLGEKYINDRLCIRAGEALGTESGRYVNIILSDDKIIPCIVCGIDKDSEKAVSGIVANSDTDSVSFKDLGYDSGMVGIEIEEESFFDKTSVGEDLAEYAKQFVGNPYVWGGSSLTNGADCSGFTMSIYSEFGISLPHNADAQSGYGAGVGEDELLPGDLIFYSGEEGIDHVAIYIGNGQVVHASNSSPYPAGGIKISHYNYRNIACIRRLV